MDLKSVVTDLLKKSYPNRTISNTDIRDYLIDYVTNLERQDGLSDKEIAKVFMDRIYGLA